MTKIHRACSLETNRSSEVKSSEAPTPKKQVRFHQPITPQTTVVNKKQETTTSGVIEDSPEDTSYEDFSTGNVITSTPVTPRMTTAPRRSMLQDSIKTTENDKEKLNMKNKIDQLEETMTFNNQINTITNHDSNLSLLINFNWKDKKKKEFRRSNFTIRRSNI